LELKKKGHNGAPDTVPGATACFISEAQCLHICNTLETFKHLCAAGLYALTWLQILPQLRPVLFDALPLVENGRRYRRVGFVVVILFYDLDALFVPALEQVTGLVQGQAPVVIDGIEVPMSFPQGIDLV
jgi:hypothetical protein